MVTDYDCWHPDHENVDVQQVIKVLLGNAAKAKNMITKKFIFYRDMAEVILYLLQKLILERTLML